MKRKILKIDLCNLFIKKNQSKKVIKGKLNSNYIFLYFVLIGLEWDSMTLFTKNEIFFLPKLAFQHDLHKIYYIYIYIYIYIYKLNIPFYLQMSKI